MISCVYLTHIKFVPSHVRPMHAKSRQLQAAIKYGGRSRESSGKAGGRKRKAAAAMQGSRKLGTEGNSKSEHNLRHINFVLAKIDRTRQISVPAASDERM